MAAVRLMNRPEDYKRLGISKEKVEIWEDGRRDDDRPNHFEWWYFDAILDDGTTIVVQFLNKTGKSIMDKKGHPTVFFKVTFPDGTCRNNEVTHKEKDSFYSRERCDVRIGNHHIEGDLKEYTIHIDPMGGMALDMKMKSLAEPYRPGTAYFEMGTPDKYYTWLCAAPRCEVSGTLTVDGKETTFHGRGYHDHQWGSVNFHKYWNHWVWARQNYDDYSLLVFDFVSSEETDYTRIPIVFLQDSTGKVIFESTDSVKCEVLDEYHDDLTSGKDYPKKLHYKFRQNGKEIEYTLSAVETLEQNGPKNAALPLRLALKVMGIYPSYARYRGQGDMVFRDAGEEIRRSGDLIFEFMYPGMTYRKQIEQQASPESIEPKQ